MDFIITLIALIFIIGILVYVHELGHFIAAKLSGVRVNEFALGWGKSIWHKEFKGTLYKINIFPIGGYVTLEGETDDSSHSHDSYANKPFYLKLFILVAGVTMNVLLAIVLSAVFLSSVNYRVTLANIVDYDFAGASEVRTIPSAIFVSMIQEGSAAEGNLREGDIIVSVNGQEFDTTDQFLTFLNENQGTDITFKLVGVPELEEREETVALPVRTDPESPLLGAGIAFDPNSYYVIDYPQNFLAGVSHSQNLFGFQIAALGQLIGQSVSENNIAPVAEQVGGIVAVSDVVGDLISIREFGALLNLTAVVSLSLAFINLFPVPVLDGGQAAIVLIETIFRRKINRNVLNTINRVSFILIIALSILITVKDIVQLKLLENLISGIRAVLGQ